MELEYLEIHSCCNIIPLASSVLLYEYTAVCLSVYLLVDIWAVSSPGLVQSFCEF